MLLSHTGHGRVSASAKRLRCGGRLFVIPRRVQHAVGLRVALEAGEQERPAFADGVEHLAAFGEIVVRDGELDLILLLFEIDHDARGLLGPVERFVHRMERVGQPPRRLSYTFHSMHEPFYGAEQPSRVVIDLEKQKDQVKLTVTHDDFAEGSKVFDAISKGWPLLLSSLKSYPK